MIYTSWKHGLESIVKKHFPDFISSRFTFRSDSEIFIPKEDESIWNAVKEDRQSMHVLFDMIEILELPHNTPRQYGEIFILRAFRDAIAEKRIDLYEKPKLTDKTTAKKARKEKEGKRKKAIEESFKFARDNAFDLKRIEAKLPPAGKSKKGSRKIAYTLGGDN